MKNITNVHVEIGIFGNAKKVLNGFSVERSKTGADTFICPRIPIHEFKLKKGDLITVKQKFSSTEFLLKPRNFFASNLSTITDGVLFNNVLVNDTGAFIYDKNEMHLSGDYSVMGGDNEYVGFYFQLLYNEPALSTFEVSYDATCVLFDA